MQKRYIAIFAAAALLNVETIVASEHNQSKINVSKPKVTQKQSHENNTTQEDKVLAIVNGQKIMQSYFDQGFFAAPHTHQVKILQRAISSELLVQFASKQPLYLDKTLIQKVNDHAQRLRAEGKKFTNVDHRMVLGLTVINKMANEYAMNEMTDEKIAKYYNERKRNFRHMKYVEAYSIKVSTLEEAKKIIHELDENKNDNKKSAFIQLAELHNKDKTSQYTGKVYKFGIPRNAYNLALFSLKKSSYTTTPIAFENSYYIIYCDRKSNTQEAPSVKELDSNIRYVLKLKLGNEWTRTKLDELKKVSIIKNNLTK